MKDELNKLLKEILGVEPDVEISTHADYSTSVCLKLSKSLKKSPMDIALEAVKKIEDRKLKIEGEGQNQKITQKEQTVSKKVSPYDVLQDIERVEAVQPGFINIYLSESKLISQLSQVLKKREAYGRASNSHEKIMVEFTDPNPFKEFHVGHLYSNAVGESLSRLFEAQGNTVRRADYYGDVGMHVAKVIWALLKNPIDEHASLPEKMQLLGQAYATGSKAYEEDKEASEEIKKLNKLIYEKDPSVQKIYETGRTWSLAYFETIYKRLGTKFDAYYPESEVGEIGAKLVRDNVGTVFEKSDGAIVFRGAHTRVFINQLGLPTYEAKELGLNAKKYQDWPFDRSYIVTGKEINEYFNVVLTAMAKIIPDIAKKTRHIGHGMVRLPTGKMSSRTGQVLTAQWLIDEVKIAINNILQNNKSNYTKEEQELIAEKAAIAAIKYSLLKVSLPSDIIFDIAKSVSFEGDSGPYLQYTYARCKSVLRKAPDFTREIGTISNAVSLFPEEREVARLIVYFPEMVEKAASSLSSSVLCSYLFSLAQAFNLFYAKHSILGIANKEGKAGKTSNASGKSDARILRLTITAATAQVLQNGLYLLGIETLEKM